MQYLAIQFIWKKADKEEKQQRVVGTNKKNGKMIYLNLTTTLDGNDLNTPIKMQRSDWGVGSKTQLDTAYTNTV